MGFKTKRKDRKNNKKYYFHFPPIFNPGR